MKLKIKKIRGFATEKQIFNKEFNIFIGISLGNKWFTKSHLRLYLRWALDNTKERVIFVIADKLHAVNLEVRNDYNSMRALRKALREGNNIERIVRELIAELSKEEQMLLDVIRWDYFEKSEAHIKGVKIFENEFDNNPQFKKISLSIVSEAVNSKKGGRKFEGGKIIKLSKYFIGELPEMLNGFEYNGVYYNLYPYPFSLAFGEFVEQIQRKKIFPELHNKMKIGNNVLVVLEIGK